VEHQLLHHTNIQMIMNEDEEEIDLDSEGPIEQK
jgi:predicted metalloprotease with PDZ domain